MTNRQVYVYCPKPSLTSRSGKFIRIGERCSVCIFYSGIGDGPVVRCSFGFNRQP